MKREEPELYREFDHTGDLGIELSAPSRVELFERALVALSHLMVEPTGVEAREIRLIELGPAADVDLIHDLLSAALTVFLADGFIWCEAEVAERAGGGLSAKLAGECFDRRRHSFIQELKAVTYHRLAIGPAGAGWRARIVMDV